MQRPSTAGLKMINCLLLALSLALLPAACAEPTATPADAGAAPDAAEGGDAGTDAGSDAPDAGSGGSAFVCNQVMGVSVTGDWFNAGFEQMVDGDRWQVISQSHAYIDLWADPANAVWAIAPVSPCAARSGDPDRVIFTGVNWTYTTAAEWTTAFTTVVGNLKAKHPGLARVDLMTMLRAPGNTLCDEYSSTETIVAPFIDEAIANVAAAHPGFVLAAPRVYAPDCDVFLYGGPHFTPKGMAEVAKAYGDYYAHEP